MFLIHDIASRTADVHGGCTAIIADGRAITHAELDRASDRLASGLRAAGAQAGDRAAIIADNSIELAIVLLGVWKAGAVTVVCQPIVRAARMSRIFDDCEPRFVFAQPAATAAVAALASTRGFIERIVCMEPRTDPSVNGAVLNEGVRRVACAGAPTSPIDEDLCAIIYTSGSTGEPKGVMLTHRNLVTTTRSIVAYLENSASDVVCSVLPMAYSYGLYQFLATLLCGGTLVLERSFVFPVELLKRIETHRVTGLPGVPGMFAAIQQIAGGCGVDLSSLRYMTNAAGPMPTAHVTQMLELFPNVRFYSMYGQTECGRACFMAPERLAQKPASVGRAIPNSELVVVDGRGAPVGPGVVGELVVRGGNVMRGYWRRPEETATKLRRNPGSGDNMLLTGDLFRMDEDGDLYFVSRTDDIIKCRGEKVAPKVVEDIICMLPEVAEAGVVGVDDPRDGQAVKAVVVIRKGANLTAERIRRHCRAHLESTMVPTIVHFVAALPRTDSGKLLRRDLARVECPPAGPGDAIRAGG